MIGEDVTALTRAIVDNAQRLGLIWNIRPALITSATLGSSTAVGIFDGDATSLPMIDLVGVAVGDRVYVVQIPQGGNYIVGIAPARPFMIPYGIHGTSIADSVAVAAYTNMVAPSSFTFTKRSSQTRVRTQMTVGFFVNNANTGMDAGVTFDGGVTTLQVTRYGATNAVGVHLQATGVQYHPLLSASQVMLPAGVYTVQGQWRREVGTGTVSRDGQDWLSIECIEVE